MKCSRCPYAPQADVNGEFDECPFYETHYKEWNDGEEGCTMTRRQLDKLAMQRAEDMGIMGLDMGMEMDFETKGISMKVTTEQAKHMIGMDERIHKPYVRHGKKFYKPWRNEWHGQNAAFEYMSHDVIGLTRKWNDDEGECYSLTRKGLDWLGRQIGVTIHDYRKREPQ